MARGIYDYQNTDAEESDKRRRHVAHKLLIELLACQFAFPVRWIETQDELFSREAAISRFVEIGPAKVLAGMAKQTADLKYADRDLARSIRRKFLSTKQDEREIYYKYETTTEETPTALVSQNEASTSMEQTHALPAAATAPVPQAAPVHQLPQIPDVPATAQDVVRSLVARKFSKAFDEISLGKSIKDLTDGKSTLQNELVGILEAEFSDLPSAPEDLPISQLSEGIQKKFSGKLGKESSRLVSRLFSSKMPAGFGQNEARNYLEQTWGLATGRQTSVLLRMLAAEPASRVSTVEAAKSLLDEIVLQHAAVSQISLSKVPASGAHSSSKAAVVDLKQVEDLQKDRQKHLSRHFKLLADELKIDLTSSDKVQNLDSMAQELQQRLDSWSSELGDDFEVGIQPAFDVQKTRRYNSSWNNVRQDIIALYHQMQNTDVPLDELTLEAKFLHILNRTDEFVCILVQNLTQIAPKTQKPRAQGFETFGRRLLKSFARAKASGPLFKYTARSMAPQTTVDPQGAIQYKEASRQVEGGDGYPQLLRCSFLTQNAHAHQPFVHVRTISNGKWLHNVEKTTSLLDTIELGATDGLSFVGKNVLLTGAGPKSIGAEVLRGLLMGGARVIVTTSRQPRDTKQFYQNIYAEFGALGSELIVLTFNQASKRDCASLIDHIYAESGLDCDLDAIIPFAAISERGEIDGLGSRSELAHRLMLTNVLRMLGHIADNKARRKIDTRPTQVLLPLSPNHGVFGSDGLYAESKLGLESLLDKCRSESWSDYLNICGAVIGWTRGTDLMVDNDIVAQAIEAQNVLTFSQKEMAFNLLALLSPSLAQANELEPLWVDLSGALDLVPDLKGLLTSERARLSKISTIRAAVAAEDIRELEAINGTEKTDPPSGSSPLSIKRSTFKVGYPKLPVYDHEILPLQHLEGMVDLSSVPVVVGFSELGPWGSSRTRWEMESRGKFSQEGYIEMAWIMNIIKYHDGDKDGEHYAGWVDSKTGAKVLDHQVGDLYGPQILEHSGVRLVEPELVGGYDPQRKEFSHEVAIEEDLPEFEASRATAEAFKLRHGENVSIRQAGDSDNFTIQLKRGASVMVSKAVPFEGFVAGQIPTGWDATKYGLPEDIVRQVDPVTAYALCCAAEALYSAGISDASELLRHVHISEIGNFVGSMMGGTTKTKNMYKDRYLDKDVQGDVMQETYLSTTAAWINMLLLGAAGPIKTPTGACATGIESIDNACDSLLTGKTKVCFVGGTDDFQEEESYAFRTMKATVNAKDELAKGRLPSEMSRPTSDTRSGFVEGQGAGLQIITTADLALRMGLPIYAVIAASTMAGDKISRSVPAPGQGVLSFARETADATRSPLLSLDYRRMEMKAAIDQVHSWRKKRLQQAYLGSNKQLSPRELKPGSPTISDSSVKTETHLADLASAINASAESQMSEIRKLWGNDFRRQNPDISPLRAALATWGLTVDDIDMASLHGTSTKANDKNEPEIIDKQMSHLKRTLGNPVLAICQKSITGHPKAPAAAFMLNGCLQALNSGLVPGNRNADNVDPALIAYPHLTFPTRPIQASSLKAFSLTSFGFGQKGGQIVGVHPRYLYGAISRASYEAYAARMTARTRSCNRSYISAVIGNRIVACKNATQYQPADQDTVLLDPYARVSPGSLAREKAWYYDPADLKSGQLEPESSASSGTNDSLSDHDGETTLYSPVDMSRKNSDVCFYGEIQKTKSWMEDVVARVGESNCGVGVGIDIEEITSSTESDLQSVFVQRNFTAQERAVAANSPDPRSTLVGRWSAKEAVFKSLGVEGKGAGAGMRDIEIIKATGGMPVVKLHSDVYAAAQDQGITDIQLSLSHSDNTAIAVALAIKGTGKPSY